jgi:hypothetical protein
MAADAKLQYYNTSSNSTVSFVSLIDEPGCLHKLVASKGTEKTMDTTVQLLNHAATHPDAAVPFYKSDMILCIHSDASYLSEPKARSKGGGYH